MDRWLRGRTEQRPVSAPHRARAERRAAARAAPGQAAGEQQLLPLRGLRARPLRARTPARSGRLGRREGRPRRAPWPAQLQGAEEELWLSSRAAASTPSSAIRAPAGNLAGAHLLQSAGHACEAGAAALWRRRPGGRGAPPRAHGRGGRHLGSAKLQALPGCCSPCAGSGRAPAAGARTLPAPAAARSGTWLPGSPGTASRPARPSSPLTGLPAPRLTCTAPSPGCQGPAAAQRASPGSASAGATKRLHALAGCTQDRRGQGALAT
jgi:hypothetical protein